MTAAAWITLALVAGFVWGGALTFSLIALRKERGKPTGSDEGPGLFVP